MGIWNEIKKALNSTLGTSEFKPLNEIMTDLVFSERRFIVSERQYVAFNTDITGNKGLVENKVALFTTQLEGSFTLSFQLGYFTSAKVYINNEMVNTYSNAGNSNVVTKSPTITVKKGDTVSIGVCGSDADRTGTVSNIKMLAEVVDNANITLLV